DQLSITEACGPVQGGRAVGSGVVDACALLDQLERRGVLAALGGGDEWWQRLERARLAERQSCGDGERKRRTPQRSTAEAHVSSNLALLSPIRSIGLSNMPATPSQRFAIGDRSGAFRYRFPRSCRPAPPTAANANG